MTGLSYPHDEYSSADRVTSCSNQPGKQVALVLRMIGDELRARSRQFALDVTALCVAMGHGDVARIVKPQLLRAATGTAANYRAACRSRSAKEFAARLSVSVEESDEAELWLDIIEANGLGPLKTVKELRNEAVQLRAIFSRSRTTVLTNLKEKAKRRKPWNPEP